jgi:hypothetical protein
MSETIPHSPNTPSWSGAKKKAQGQLYLYLYHIIFLPTAKDMPTLSDQYKHGITNIDHFEVQIKANVKLSLCLTKHQSMKGYWRMEV